jgi:glycosyltransferase involved in cell wall biosynthesis
LKITFLTPHINISGGVKIILEYANRLARKGHSVTVICPQTTFKKIRVKGIPVIYPKRFLMNLLGLKPSWVEVACKVKFVPSYEEIYIPDADIVVATAWQTASFVNNYRAKKGRKFYLIQHYESLYHGEKAKVDDTYQYPMTKIVVSSWLRDLFKENFKSDSELIINPIDLDVFYPEQNPHSRCGRICMLYHTYAWKGIKDGVRAFEIAKKKYPQIQIVMFGANKKTADINCEYHYKPVADELRKVYNSCGIFLCPSWMEGFGLPSAEAMACKCVLVTTDNGGCRDYAIHEKTALVSPPQNPQALAENLCRLLSNKDLFEKIAQSGYEHIKRFTWEKAVRKMEKVFLQDLQKKLCLAP